MREKQSLPVNTLTVVFWIIFRVFRELLDLNLDSPAPFGALGGRSLSVHLKVLHLVVQEQPGLRRPRDGDLGQLVRLLV